ncbi:MAG: glycosyltransferase [Proteobacteria bacterium]|nr:glycosyltransferase [Pseudomonadota bacterium]MBU4259062.1 glycosyltransferase [Pseudomonadota bacterium]MBU4286598.1 glycosyltransferase [Pseudomonadota bacterium]
MEPQTKVLIFHPALAPYRVSIFNELSNLLNLKVIFLRDNLLNQKFDQKLLRSLLKCNHDFLLSGFDIRSRAFRWGITKAISKFNPDVVVCMEYSPITLWISLQKLCRINKRWRLTIWTADNIDMCNSCSWLRSLARKTVLSVADSMIVYSKSVKSRYTKYGVSSSKIGICPNIQREDTFRNSLSNYLSIANRLIAERSLNGKRIVLFVGRLVKIKGVDRLLKAFIEVSKSVPDSLLVIVGDGPERLTLEKLALRSGIKEQVIFEGRLEGADLLVWYLLGDLFVLPSHHEPYGAVVNEALMAGMPVLCSNRAGASDLICEGKNGYIFDPYDTSRLARLIIEQLRNKSLVQEKIKLRQSLMPISFNESVQGFVQAVNYAFTTPN